MHEYVKALYSEYMDCNKRTIYLSQMSLLLFMPLQGVDSPVLWYVCTRLSVAPTCDIPTHSVIIVSATTDALTINVAITAIANVVDVSYRP